ncbi:hypothetical protein N781_14810 [Pontibacillus halophilus JSM 076056 = DSM 19796]|uniref:SigE-dependent sporulation protein n=1 Tax=Pontibacillus halophilus JSM 076056 = DSM 19796 TaxID=1385510 RepID=A0A0A5GKV2_9BACI|nr:sporulation YhaL family protein [Pontibacillus halophilus]KGX92599.1 hypothetical protein N781_14810 [Pontibacillus halophilus JSM 076056 = DSM 19796]
MIAQIPWWVLLVIAFTLFSGYMAFRANRDEYQLNQRYIEQEGQKYMDRIQEEKEKREQQRVSGT